MTVQIDPKATIVGLPILRVRHALRRPGYVGYRVWSVAEDLRVSERVARRLLRLLEAEGYVEPAGRDDDGGPIWKPTDKGSALAAGRATPRIHRRTADRLLAALLARMHELETRADLLYRVEKAILFGSFLRDVDRLGDLDVAVMLAPKVADRERQHQLEMERTRAAIRAGRRFSNLTQEMYFAQDEVWRFLRGGSRFISLQDLNDPPDRAPTGGVRVIYPVEAE